MMEIWTLVCFAVLWTCASTTNTSSMNSPTGTVISTSAEATPSLSSSSVDAPSLDGSSSLTISQSSSDGISPDSSSEHAAPRATSISGTTDIYPSPSPSPSLTSSADLSLASITAGVAMPASSTASTPATVATSSPDMTVTSSISTTAPVSPTPSPSTTSPSMTTGSSSSPSSTSTSAGPSASSVSTTVTSSSLAMTPTSTPAIGMNSTAGIGNAAISLPLIVGSAASIVVLAFTNAAQLVMCFFSSSRGYDFVHINIVVGLICGLIFLLVGNTEAITADTLTCQVFSGLTTYFLLVPFVWFLAEAVFMYFYIRGIATGKYYIALVLLIFCFCWLLPALVTVVTGVVANENAISGTDKLIQQCWLTTDGGTVAAFLVPVVILSLLTVAVCFLLAWTLRKQKFKEDTEQQKLRKSVIYGLECLAALLPLMTVTWVIASLYVGFGNLVLGWIYAAVVVITAIAVFVMYVVVKAVPLIVMKLDKSVQLNEESRVEMTTLSNTLTYKEDTEKKEDDAAPSGPAAAGVSTFKPGMENGATDTAVGADGGGDTADGTEKKKEEGEQADPEGDKVQGDGPTGFSTFKPSGLKAADEAPKNEPHTVDKSGGADSSTDQATPLQAETGTASKSEPSEEALLKVNASEGAPKEKLEVLEAKASSTDEPSPSEAGKKEEVEKKDIPAVEKGKDEGVSGTAAAVSDAVPTDKVDN